MLNGSCLAPDLDRGSRDKRTNYYLNPAPVKKRGGGTKGVELQGANFFSGLRGQTIESKFQTKNNNGMRCNHQVWVAKKKKCPPSKQGGRGRRPNKTPHQIAAKGVRTNESRTPIELIQKGRNASEGFLSHFLTRENSLFEGPDVVVKLNVCLGVKKKEPKQRSERRVGQAVP